MIDAALLARSTRVEERWRRLPVLPTASAGPEGHRLFGVVGRF